MSQFISRLIDMLKNDRPSTQGEIRRSVAGAERVIGGYILNPNWGPIKQIFGELINCGGCTSGNQVQDLLENPNLELDGSLLINIGNISDCFMVPTALYDSTLLQITCKKVIDLNVLLAGLLQSRDIPREIVQHVLHTTPMRKIAILLAIQIAKIAKTHGCEAAAIRYHSIADSLIQKALPEGDSEADYDEFHKTYPYSIVRCWTYCRDKHVLNSWMVPVELVDKDHFEKLGYAEVVHRVMESIITHLNIGNASEHHVLIARAVCYLRSIFSVNSLVSEAFSEMCASEFSDAVFHIPDSAGTLSLVECFIRINRRVSEFGSRVSLPALSLLSDILYSKASSDDDALMRDMVKAHACVIMFLMELIQFDDSMSHALTSVIIMHFEAFTKFVNQNQLGDTKQVPPLEEPTSLISPNDAAIEWISKYSKEFSTSVYSVTFSDGVTRTF